MIGRSLGLAILATSLYVVYMFEGTTFGHGALRIFHWPAIQLTFLGPLGIMMISTDLKSLWQSMSYFFRNTPRTRLRQRQADAVFLEQLLKRFYTDGSAVFDAAAPRQVSPMVRKLVERLALRIPHPDVKELVEAERERRAQQIAGSLTVVSLGVRLAPSVGMLGTILGMVQLLSKLKDPAQIGANMSLALFTTFYGLFFSLVLWTPLHYKLERTLAQEIQAYDEVLRWIELLERRKPGDYFADATNEKAKGGLTEARAA